MIIEKPKGYKSHMIVYDPYPKLIIDLDYTVFQASMKLGKDYEEFEVTEDGDHLIVTEI